MAQDQRSTTLGLLPVVSMGGMGDEEEEESDEEEAEEEPPVPKKKARKA